MVIFVALLIGALTLVYVAIKYQMGYWRRRGIPHDKPNLLMGNMTGWQKTKHISKIFADTYNKYKDTGPFAGFYFIMKHCVVATDVDLIKNVLIKDFHNFNERGIYHNEVDDPLTGNLFFTDGERWHRLRHKMTPTFTSGKMKYMFSTVVKVGQDLNTIVKEKTITGSTDSTVLEITDLLSRYTADVIGTCAFGLDCNSLRNPNAEFVMMGKRFLTTPRHSKIVDFFIHSFPEFARRMHMRIVDQTVHDFYMGIVRDTIAYREKNNIKRNDFMDILIDLMKPTKDDSGQELSGLTVEEVAAQAFVFFIAGFETSSTTMAFALYELAQNQQVQDKLRNEINEVVKKHEGPLSYECMKDMHYLDQVINETLRKHPVAAHLVRNCKERYETSDPKYYIEKGTIIIIPSLAIHYDTDIYPEPQRFRPERFDPQEIQKRPACSWLPFGEGPRNCIGLRFGKMQACIGLALLIKDFRFTVCEKTKIPYDIVNKSFVMSPDNGIHLKVEHV